MNLIQILMTPSEVTNTILICIFAYLESFLLEMFFIKLLDIHTSKLSKFLYVLLSGTIGIISNHLLNNLIAYFTNLMFCFILIYKLFNQTLKKSFIALLCSYICIFISAYLSQILISKSLQISSVDILNIPLYHILTSLLLYMIFGLFYIIMCHKDVIIKSKKTSLKQLYL